MILQSKGRENMISKEPKPEIRTVIVDDENLARKNLKELLRDHP